MLTDSPNKDRIEKVLREGVTTEFWETLKEAIDDKLEMLEKNFLTDLKVLKDYTAEECKIQMNVYLAKKTYLEGLKELPLNIVHSFKEPIKSEQDDEIYATKKDFLPKKKKE